jgi:protein-disulfide isomerase
VLAACGKPAAKSESVATSADASAVAAVVGGETITMGELDAEARDQLSKVSMQIYQIKKRVLDSMIEDKLLAAAAKKKGVAVEKYMEEEIGSKATPPSDEEVKALYDARKGAINKPFEEVKDQIAAFLAQNKKMQAQAEVLAALRKDAIVKIELNPPRTRIELGDAAPSMGDKDAKVTLVEFSDYQCPFCKRVRPTIWRLMDEYKGKIRYVFLDFPLSFHKDSKKAHEAARCAGDQGKYFEFNRKVFDTQEKISVADLKNDAKELKLDTKKFDECLDAGTYARAVDESIKKGADSGVSGTPAFFINGIMISGSQPYEAFKDLIDSELSR